MESSALPGSCVYAPDVLWQTAGMDFLPPENVVSVIVAESGQFTPEDFRKFSAELDPEEQERGRSFINEESRKQFLLSHYLLRWFLAPMVGLKPGELRFGSTFHKKPILVNGNKPVHFNISHAGEKVSICLCHEDPVGVDVEKINPDFEFRSFAEEHFSAGEKRELQEENDRALVNFFILWSRKESFLKLTGEGISDDLKNLDMSGRKFSREGTGPVIRSTLLDGYAISVAITEEKEIRYFLLHQA